MARTITDEESFDVKHENGFNTVLPVSGRITMTSKITNTEVIIGSYVVPVEQASDVIRAIQKAVEWIEKVRKS